MSDSYFIRTDRIGVFMMCEGDADSEGFTDVGGYVRKVLYDVNGDDSDTGRQTYAEGLAAYLGVPAGPSR
jgi:hypothetical protein